jgi:paraquat-inducible protein A
MDADEKLAPPDRVTPARARTLRAAATGPDRLIGVLLLASAALLGIGWALPVMSLRTAFIFYDEVSIASGAIKLLQGRQIFLFAVIVVFSILFPAAKVLAALYVWYLADLSRGRLMRLLGWIEALGKWSMLDVFVVALFVIMIQGSLTTEIALHNGLYAFAAAVLLSMLITQRMSRLAQRLTA